jgi:hypothetical protein
MALPIQTPSVPQGGWSPLAPYFSGMAKKKQTKKKASRKRSTDPEDIALEAIVHGVADENFESLPDWLKDSDDQFQACRVVGSGDHCALHIYYLNCVGVRKYEFRLRDGVVTCEMSDDRNEAGNQALGQRSFDIQQPGSLEHLIAHVKSMEYMAYRKDVRIRSLTEEVATLNKRIRSLSEKR